MQDMTMKKQEMAQIQACAWYWQGVHFAEKTCSLKLPMLVRLV